MCRLAMIFLCFFSGAAQAASVSDYWGHSEFYQAHPEQRAWLAELSNAVRSKPQPLDQKQTEPVRIGLVYPSNQASSYWIDNEAAFRARLQQLGIGFELEARYTAPSTELDEQVAQIRELLEWEPDYLVYTLDSVQQKMIIERLMLNHDTKLILQNITTPLKSWGDRQPFLYAGFDHAEGARKLAAYFSREFPGESLYAVLFRNRGVVSQMRGTGFVQSVDRRHHLVASYYTDSSREGGKQAALGLLEEHPELDYIYACSTDVALGVLDALALNKLEQPPSVNGWGGGPEEVDELRRGRLDVVLMRMNDDSAIAMAEAIKRDLENRPVPQIYSGTFVVLDRSMTDAQIDRYVRLSRRALSERVVQ